MKVGIYDMTSKDYHAADGCSKSTIFKLEGKTDLAFEQFLKDGVKETEAMKFGTMIHCSVLEGECFNDRYTLAPDINKNTKEYKAFKESLGAKLPLDQDDKNRVDAMTKNIKSHVLANAVLMGKHEKSFFWLDKETQLICKCRPDSIHLNAGIIADLKSADEINADDWIKKAYDLGYHVQAAFYLDGVEAAIQQSGNSLGLQTIPDKFVFVAVESKAPYQVAVYDFPDFFIDEGRKTYKRLLWRYKKFARNKIEGKKAETYPASIITIQPKPYMFKKEGEI